MENEDVCLRYTRAFLQALRDISPEHREYILGYVTGARQERWDDGMPKSFCVTDTSRALEKAIQIRIFDHIIGQYREHEFETLKYPDRDMVYLANYVVEDLRIIVTRRFHKPLAQALHGYLQGIHETLPEELIILMAIFVARHLTVEEYRREQTRHEKPCHLICCDDEDV